MLTLTKDQISTAPADVQSWLAGTIGLPTPSAENAVASETATPPKVDRPTKEDVLTRATEFCKSDEGKGKLKAILDEMGIKRVGVMS